MAVKEKLICQICKRSESERPIYLASTLAHIDERYEFPPHCENDAFCVNCAKEHFLVNGFVTYRFPISIDFYYNHSNWYDVVHLSGTAYIMPIKEDMYILRYEDSYIIDPDLHEEDFENEDDYWKAKEEGAKEVRISILVVVNSKSIIGKGSKQYRSLIEDIIKDFKLNHQGINVR